MVFQLKKTKSGVLNKKIKYLQIWGHTTEEDAPKSLFVTGFYFLFFKILIWLPSPAKLETKNMNMMYFLSLYCLR